MIKTYTYSNNLFLFVSSQPAFCPMQSEMTLGHLQPTRGACPMTRVANLLIPSC